VSLKQEEARITKMFGDGSIMRLGDPSLSVRGVISTGVPALDEALGVGGFPRGRVIEMYGPPGGGKSTIAQQVIAQAQLAGGTAAYVDAEHSLDPKYATALGININDLLVSQPDYGEQGLEIAHALVRSQEVDVVVIDSIASLIPKAEVDGDMGDQFMGLQARMLGQGMRKIVADVHSSNTVLLLINQIRHKLGVTYGPTETTPGGESVRHYASVRVDIRRIAAIKNGEDVIGARTKAKIVKNKVAAPFKEAEFDIVYGKGAPYANGLVDVCTENGLIERSGSWLTLPNGDRFQGRDKVIEVLTTNPEVARSLREKLQERLNDQK
jgi:recombination protein RecA